MDLKFSHVAIVIADLDKAVSYYQRVLGCKPAKKQTWQRGEFHVEYVVMFKDAQRFYLVYPHSGNLKALLEAKGSGTIYRFCHTTKDIKACIEELVAAGVRPVTESEDPITEQNLVAPTGVPTIFLPKVFGGLSIEILEEEAMEARVANVRLTAAE